MSIVFIKLNFSFDIQGIVVSKAYDYVYTFEFITNQSFFISN